MSPSHPPSPDHVAPDTDDKDESFAHITSNARRASDKEHAMSLWQGIRLYPKAVMWSVLISSTICMEGYDVCLLSNFYGFTPFKKQFGQLQPDGSYQVPASWQAGLSNGVNVGEIIGLFINGYVSERFGYRYTVIACLVLLSGLIAIFFTATNVQTLLVAEILAGLPWGVFQTLTITYASEVCPVALRGYLTCYVNFCWGLGQLVGVGVIKAMVGRTDEWSYRIPYALQWMWIPGLLVAVVLAPESPWWLVRHGRLADARRSLLRLTSPSGVSLADPTKRWDVDETLDMMRHTTELETDLTAGASYLDCFRGVDLRRTEIVCMVWAIQNLSGNSFSGFSSYFLQQAGLDESTSYSFAMVQYAINMVGVFGAWTLMAYGIGRRSLYLYGLCGLCAALFVMGFLGLVPPAHRQAGSMATGVMMIVWALFYQLTVGTVAYSLVAELSTRRLQIKTVVLGRNLYNVVNIVASVLTPYMINPTQWGWSNYAAFFWGGSCLLCVVYTYYRVPDVTGRSFAEIDLLFERRVPARGFAEAKVDVFESEVTEGLVRRRQHQADEKAAGAAEAGEA